MRIYLQEFGDPMIAGTLFELNDLADKLHQFVVSHEDKIIIPVLALKSPAPHCGLLERLKITKQKSSIMISIESNCELSVVGSAENLAFWVSHFRFPDTAQDGDHHHPESYSRAGYIQPGSLSTIIEIENAEDAV